MNGNIDADILVIGASPAGTAAAQRAALDGAGVILIDRKDDFGHPPHPANTFFRFMMDRNGEPILDDYVVKRLRGMKIISPAGSTVEIETPGYFIDRQKFDAHYKHQLVEAGVEIRTGVEALSVMHNDQGIMTSTSDGVLNSKLVIAADGIESGIAARMGLRTTWYPADIAWAAEAQVRAPGIGEFDMFEYYLGKHSPGWKSTYSPAGGDRATLGVYVRRRGRNVSSFFYKWIERFARLKGYDADDIEITALQTGGDPIATIPRQLVTHGFMVTGGAAGQSGIGYGMRAGQICGGVAAAAVAHNNVSAKRLREYPMRWKKEFAMEYWLGRIGLETVRKMTDREIDTTISVFAGQDLTYLRGPPLLQAVKTGLFIAQRRPSALTCFGALLRRR